MAIIYSYPAITDPQLSDLLLVTDVSSSDPKNQTKTMTLQQVADLVDDEVTLQEVLDAGNTATQNIILTGDITASNITTTSTLSIGGTSSFTGSAVFNNRVQVLGTELILNSPTTTLQFQGDAGTSKQVMVSNGPGITPSWVDPETLPAGNVEFEVNLTEAVVVGDPLHIVSNIAGVINVEKAQAGNVAKMPAAGIAKSAGNINDTISMIEVGTLEGNFLASGSTGDVLYVGTTGGLTTTRPTAVTDFVQNAGIITRQSGVNDRMQVTCIGRTNDTPNVISLTKRFEVTDDRGSNNVTFGAESFNQATSGEQNVAVGFDAGSAVTTTNNNVMVGFSAAGGSNIGSDNVVIGHQAGTTITSLGANLNTLLGKSAGDQLTSGVNNVFVGGFAGNGTGNGNGSQNVILGANSTSDGSDSIVIGPAISATGATSAEANKMIVIGSQITAENGAAVLPSNSGTSITIGAGDSGATKLSNLAQNGILLGSSSLAGQGLSSNADSSVGIGTDVLVDADSGVAIGLTAKIFENAQGSVAIGEVSEVTADSEYSVAIGSSARGRGDRAISIGLGASTQDGFSRQIAIGTQARTINGNDNVAIGNNAAATAGLQGNALAIMPNSEASAQYAIAIGTNARATTEGAIALGTNAQAQLYNTQINIRNTPQGSLRQFSDRAAALVAVPALNDGDLYVLTPGGPDNPGTSFVLAIL